MGLSESCFHRQRRLREKEGAGPRLLKLPFLLARWDWSIVSPASVKGGSWAWWCGVSMWGWFHLGLSCWEPSTGAPCRLVDQ